ncbi:MAG: DUF2145 domain-containing protein [Sphaerotilus sulfidivorans]|uniref:DUF2145 domain-containing protein n=1 Tax=Sphaerotilus sulfidivorans TaxID=639200 RepID=UPI003F3AD272
MSRAAAWPLALLIPLLLLALPARADLLRPCAVAPDPGPRAIGRMLMLAERVRSTLESSGRRVALVSRAGLDLDRIGHRFSHAGFSVRASADGPWSVRQLYYACEEGRSRLFDQGLAGFLAGAERPESVFTIPTALKMRGCLRENPTRVTSAESGLRRSSRC